MKDIGQPEASEYAPYYARYVSLVPGGNILRVLEKQAGDLQEVLSAIPEDRAGFRYAAEKWSIREVLGHVIDVERVFGYRALSFARGEKAPLPPFDENEYARQSGHDAIPLAELLQEFESVRAATVLLLRHLSAESWLRVGVASGKAVSVRALAFIMGGHVEHHLTILHERYGVPGGH